MSGAWDLDEAVARFVQDARSRLAEAPAVADAPFRYPVLATIAQDGTPSARTLVLRGFEPERWLFTLHTDSRSEKMAEVQKRDDAALVFYDHAAGLQIRVKGRLTVEGDLSLLKATWENLPASNTLNYSSERAPGTALAHAGSSPATKSAGSAQDGFKHFAILVFIGASVDLLHLSRSGNRRYHLDLEQKREFWLAP